jgi:hypothetical protein
MMILPILFLSFPFPTDANDLVLVGTLSKGRQPQFEIIGERIDYMRHEDHGPKKTIWVAWEMLSDAKGALPANQKSSFEKELFEARRISNELMETVRGLLMQEIQKGGFASAVRVCSQLAQEMTSRFSKHTGHYLRRVSLRYRNPKNIPDEYETKRLLEFERFLREKRLSEEYVEIVEEKGVPYLRYMKPLTVGALCITCHGPKENIPSEVQAILKERYPEDRATGFLVGDLRGAISVKIALGREKNRSDIKSERTTPDRTCSKSKDLK